MGPTEMYMRQVVPIRDIYNPVDSKYPMFTTKSLPQPVHKYEEDKLHFRDDYANLFGELQATPTSYFTKSAHLRYEDDSFTSALDPKLSPQLVDWLNIYDLAHNPEEKLNAEASKSSQGTLSTWYPTMRNQTTTDSTTTPTTTTPTTTTTTPSTTTPPRIVEDPSKLKCVKWANCEMKMWP